MFKIVFYSFFILLQTTILFAYPHITATKVLGNVSSIGPKSKAWLSANYTNIILFPQNAISSIDINGSKAKKVKIKAIYDGSNISFLINWSDRTKNIEDAYNNNLKSDKYAIEFPKKFTRTDTLPYIGMGNSGRSVIVYSNKIIDKYPDINSSTSMIELFDSIEKNQYKIAKRLEQKQKIFQAESFKSIDVIRKDNSKAKMTMIYKNGKWLGSLSMKLKSNLIDLDTSSFPVAFALFDADNNQSNEIISQWIRVKLMNKLSQDTSLESLDKDIIGDIQNGKNEVEKYCVVCHRYKENKMAPDFMAPNLSNIGGYSTNEYLLQSIINPSEIIVENYKNSTYAGFDWYSIDSNGKKISTMPSFDWMDDKTKNDIVAFLKTLKADVE